MTAGFLRLSLFIHNSNSLKEKRMILHSLKAKLRNNFNVAVTQIDDEDKWQRAILAVASVEKNRAQTNRTLSNVVNFIERSPGIELLDYELELL